MQAQSGTPGSTNYDPINALPSSLEIEGMRFKTVKSRYNFSIENSTNHTIYEVKLRARLNETIPNSHTYILLYAYGLYGTKPDDLLIQEITYSKALNPGPSCKSIKSKLVARFGNKLEHITFESKPGIRWHDPNRLKTYLDFSCTQYKKISQVWLHLVDLKLYDVIRQKNRQAEIAARRARKMHQEKHQK